jgi:pseudouridine-5'-phosphate glycosidase
VIGYRCDHLPAFYCRDSGLRVDVRLEAPEEIARVMKAKWELGLGGGLVVANPIPERYALSRAHIERAIEQALSDAHAQGVSGKAATPFLLERVNALTGGESLAGNVQLVLNNARLAAAVAVAYAALAT